MKPLEDAEAAELNEETDDEETDDEETDDEDVEDEDNYSEDYDSSDSEGGHFSFIKEGDQREEIARIMQKNKEWAEKMLAKQQRLRK